MRLYGSVLDEVAIHRRGDVPELVPHGTLQVARNEATWGGPALLAVGLLVAVVVRRAHHA